MRRSMPGSGAAVGSLIALSAALALTVILIVLGAPDPLHALGTFFAGPWSSRWFLGNTLDSVVLLALSALAVSVAFRGGAFNLGGEGQIYLGGLAASVVLLSFPSLPPALALAAAGGAALAVGGGMGALSGILKRFAGADEMITSFLLSAALSPVADYLLSGPLRDPSGSLLASRRFPADRVLPHLLSPSSLSLSAPLTLLILVLFHVYSTRTAWGYRFRIAGAAPEFARYAGIAPERYRGPAMAASGAFHGLAGFFAVAGTYGVCHRGFPGGLGWNAIAVALIARNKSAALLPAALAYGWLKAGAEGALLATDLKLETSSFIQAAVLLLATVRYVRFLRSR